MRSACDGCELHPDVWASAVELLPKAKLSYRACKHNDTNWDIMLGVLGVPGTRNGQLFLDRLSHVDVTSIPGGSTM